ncbi:MATE family efflux transporter [Luteimicrobium subarcticum]|uniref:Putative MATE family efflux protein n=1 Tax=Luteimicrobium subarcticum TaxID=620910 RepID=A0A2M8W6Q7_9MICO|nr:MATE family efflux transporter [Luteimicrobium subarcticum]PJI86606.1 putative MATE family efflux protein [Luteimicrobium subarcticum]
MAPPDDAPGRPARDAPAVRPGTAAAALGTQPVGRLLWHACSQTTLSVGVYGIYALTNAWFVARGVGATAVAAVNLVAPVLLGLGAVSTAVGVGGASLVSRALGAGRTERAAVAAGNAFAVFWAAALATTVGGLLLLDPLLALLGVDAATHDLARDYAVVLLAGAAVSTGFSSLVRAEGRMRFSTMLWVVPVVVQIVLDPLFIYGMHLGVRGAALGTVGGQAVSAGMSVWFFFVQRGRPYRVGLRELRPRAAVVRALFGVGAPSFLAGFGATLLTVLVNTSLSHAGGAAGGAVALAAYAVCARLQTFATMPQVGISQGLQPVVGYNAGAGLRARVGRARTLALRSTVVYSVAVAVVLVALARPLVGVFVDAPAVVDTGADALRVLAVGIAAAGVAPLVSAYFQAIGRPRPSYVISLGTLLVLKVPLVVVLGRLGVIQTWVALAAGEAAAAAVALVVLRRLVGRDAAAARQTSVVPS